MLAGQVRDHEMILDHLAVLMRSEDLAYPCCQDYIHGSHNVGSFGSDGRMDEAWRRKLCDWSFSVVDHFEYDREVVSIAMNYLDRSMAVRTFSTNKTHQATSKKDFQLLAISSLYIAIKVHGQTERSNGARMKMKLSAFVHLGRGMFPSQEIEASERQVLADLNWRVNPPTTLRFLQNYLKLLPTWSRNGDLRSHDRVKNVIFEVARYMTELSVCDSKFAFSLQASAVAYASILCALDVLQENVVFPYEARKNFLKNLAEATGFVPQDPTILKAVGMLKELCPSMFQEGEIPCEFGFSQSWIVEDDAPTSMASEGQGKASPISVVNTTQVGYHEGPREEHSHNMNNHKRMRFSKSTDRNHA